MPPSPGTPPLSWSLSPLISLWLLISISSLDFLGLRLGFSTSPACIPDTSNSCPKLLLISSPIPLLIFLWRYHLMPETGWSPSACDGPREAKSTYDISVCNQTDWEDGFLLTGEKKNPGLVHYIQEGRCWDPGGVDFQGLAGKAGEDFQQSVGNASVHDRLLILVTEMKAQELFWKV